MSATAPPAPAASPEAASYLAAVEAGLAGVPPAERAELLDDLTGHLAELSAEGPVSLHDVLGPPEAYAAELLATLGVVAGGGGPPSRRARLRAAAERSAPMLAVRRMWDSWGGREASSVAGALQPAWWVLRAYFAVSLLATVSIRGHFPGFPFPRLFHNGALGALATLIAIPVSVRLGRVEARGVVKALVVAANVGVLIYAGYLFGHLPSSNQEAALQQQLSQQANQVQSQFSGGGPYQNCLTNGAGQVITNLYPYTMDGKLTQVLLYDQTGQPINNLCPYNDAQGRQLNNQYAKDANGAAVYNVFPRQQTVTLNPFESPKSPFGPPSPVPFGESPTPETSPVPPPAIVIPQLAATPTSTASATNTVTPSGQ